MELASAIANLGFPIGLSIFLLTKMESRMVTLINSISGKDGVLDKLDTISEKLDKLPKLSDQEK
jgi:hypothetical protein